MLGTEDFVVTTTVNSNCQITLPPKICHALNIKEGQILKFTVREGHILLNVASPEVAPTDAFSDEVFIPHDMDLLLFGKCVGQCTIC